MDEKQQVYKCPMHSEVASDNPGNCTKCGMDLVLEENKEEKSGEQK